MSQPISPSLRVRTERGVRHFSSPSEVQSMVRSSMKRAKNVTTPTGTQVLSDGSVSLAVSSLKPIADDRSGQMRRPDVELVEDSREDGQQISPRETGDASRSSPPCAPKFNVRTEDGRQVIMTREQMNEYVQRTILRKRAEVESSDKSKIAKITKRFNNRNSIVEEEVNEKQVSKSIEKSDSARNAPSSPSKSTGVMPTPLEVTDEEQENYATPPESPTSKQIPLASPNRRFSWSSVEESESCEIDDDTLAYQSDVLVDSQGQLTSTIDLSNSTSAGTQPKSEPSEAIVDLDEKNRQVLNSVKVESPMCQRPVEKGRDISPVMSGNDHGSSTIVCPDRLSTSPISVCSAKSQGKPTPEAPSSPRRASRPTSQSATPSVSFPLYSMIVPNGMVSNDIPPAQVSPVVSGVEVEQAAVVAVEKTNDNQLGYQQDQAETESQESDVNKVARKDRSSSSKTPVSPSLERGGKPAAWAQEELDDLMRAAQSISPRPFDEPDHYPSSRDSALSPDIFEGLSSCEEHPKTKTQPLQPIKEEGGSIQKTTDTTIPSSKDPNRRPDAPGSTMGSIQGKARRQAPLRERNGAKAAELDQSRTSVSSERKDEAFGTPRKLFAPIEKASASPSRQASSPKRNSSPSKRQASPSKRLAAIPFQPDVSAPPSRDEMSAAKSPKTSKFSSIAADEAFDSPQEMLVLMNTLSDVQRDEQDKVEIMKRSPVGTSVISPSPSSSDDDAVEINSRRSSNSKRSKGSKSPVKRSSAHHQDKKASKKSSPRKSKNDDDSHPSRRQRKRKSSRKNTKGSTTTSTTDTRKKRGDIASDVSVTDTSVVVNDELLKVIASKKGTILSAEDLNKILVGQSPPVAISGKSSRKKVAKKANDDKVEEKDDKEDKDLMPKSLLALSRGCLTKPTKESVASLATDEVELEDDELKGFASKFCTDVMEVFEFYLYPPLDDNDGDDETTLEEVRISSPREWIGSVLDFGQSPSSTIDETETEAEQGVFDKLAEELHTIIEVSSESDVENQRPILDVPAHRSFSFSQGNAETLSGTFSNTDNEIEPGWYKLASESKKATRNSTRK